MTRRNPNYPPWHCFTTMICDKCGEMFEPTLPHICKKANSYPIKNRENT